MGWKKMKKKIRVSGYRRKQNGKIINVRPHSKKINYGAYTRVIIPRGRPREGVRTKTMHEGNKAFDVMMFDGEFYGPGSMSTLKADTDLLFDEKGDLDLVVPVFRTEHIVPVGKLVELSEKDPETRFAAQLSRAINKTPKDEPAKFQPKGIVRQEIYTLPHGMEIDTDVRGPGERLLWKKEQVISDEKED